jgi:predicted dehydrogenase
MLKHPDIDAVLIASTSSEHADQTIAAIDSGFHVFCEKPLATSVADAERVVEKAAKHPKQKVLCGFSRRFDDSYQDAKRKVEDGFVGRPLVFRSQTCDRQDETGFFVKYAANSGGILVDCAIHDLDLAMYFLGDDVQPAVLSAQGSALIYPELAEWNDADNAFGLIKFHDGRVANFFASRMMVHGQEDVTEIIGDKGKLSVNKNPHLTLATIHDEHGIRNEVPKDFYGRFEFAFVNEMNAFAGYVLEDKVVPFSLEANVRVLQWAKWLQESLETGKQIFVDKDGNRIAGRA